ncbi:MAG: hypothetical protein ACYDFT_03245, partial [Thermoplasmata archaeon]
DGLGYHRIAILEMGPLRWAMAEAQSLPGPRLERPWKPLASAGVQVYRGREVLAQLDASKDRQHAVVMDPGVGGLRTASLEQVFACNSGLLVLPEECRRISAKLHEVDWRQHLAALPARTTLPAIFTDRELEQVRMASMLLASQGGEVRIASVHGSEQFVQLVDEFGRWCRFAEEHGGFYVL